MGKRYFSVGLFAFLGGILTLSIGVKPFFSSQPIPTEVKTTLRLKPEMEAVEASSAAHALLFFDQTTFYPSLAQAKKEDKRFVTPIRGGIIPHHLLPSFILADFFHRLSFQNPKRIILIGPNHYERGNFQVLTSQIAWDTPAGNVEPDLVTVTQIIDSNLARVDEAVLTREHSIGGMTPFIKYYLPQTKIVPLILSARMSLSQIDELASKLKDYMDEQTVLLAPVDFSHYLTSTEAQEKDKVSWQVLQDYDYPKLLKLNNDYLDSPPSIATLLKVMERINAKTGDLLYNTNSGILTNQPNVSTTSYFSVAYH